MNEPLPSPAPHVCVMYLVRHGATANNLAKPPRVQGSGSDLSLSEEGQAQARAAGEFLRGLRIDAFYASTMKRAKETAEIIASMRENESHEVSVVDALAEIDVGDWEGRSWVDIERDDPEGYRRFMTEPEMYGYAGGENLTQLLDRVTPAIDALFQQHLGQVICVVAHNVVNRSFMGRLLGLPAAKARSVPQDNCGINVLRWRDNQIKVATINARFHLGLP